MLDFSSAFNTVQPFLIVQRMTKLEVPAQLCLWICDFLKNREQFVKVGSQLSEKAIINVGSPQGCVLSPLLFIIYTNELGGDGLGLRNTTLLKFADDTAIVGLIENDDESEYRNSIVETTKWCRDNYLYLNENKSKEMIFDFNKQRYSRHQPITLNGKVIEIVEEAKHLGVLIDKQLNFEKHINDVQKKVNKRMFIMKKIYQLKLNRNITSLAFQAFVQPLIFYCCSLTCSAINKKLLHKLMSSVRLAEKRLWIDKGKTEHIMDKMMLKKVLKILKNSRHPLNKKFRYLPSGKRFDFPFCRTTRFKRTFVPEAIARLNQSDCIPF